MYIFCRVKQVPETATGALSYLSSISHRMTDARTRVCDATNLFL